MAENIGTDMMMNTANGSTTTTNNSIVPRAPIILFSAGHGETHTPSNGFKMLTRRLRYHYHYHKLIKSYIQTVALVILLYIYI